MKISTILYVPSPYPARGKMVLPQHWRRSSNGVNGVGNAKCGVDGLESLQECHFYSVFFLSCFQFWWIFVSIFGGFYFQGSLGVNFTSVRILHALLKPPWTGTSPAKVSITKATCWASHLLVFSFLMYCCIVLH